MSLRAGAGLRVPPLGAAPLAEGPHPPLPFHFYSSYVKLIGKAQPEVVVPVVGRAVAAGGGPAVAGAAVPSAATVHAVKIGLCGIRHPGKADRACTRTCGIRLGGRAVRAKPVLTPFPHIPAHVVDTQFVRRFRLDGMGVGTPIFIVPRHVTEVIAAAVLIATRGHTATSRKLPLRFGRQAEMSTCQCVELLKKGLAVVPAYILHRPLLFLLTLGGIASHHRDPQFLRHLCLADVIVTQCHTVRWFFFIIGVQLLGGGAHDKSTAGNRFHRKRDTIDGVYLVPIIKNKGRMLAVIGASIGQCTAQFPANTTPRVITIIRTAIGRCTTQFTTDITPGMVTIISTTI